MACGLLVLFVAGYMAYELVDQARPALDRYGLGFITGTTWDPVKEVFGGLPSIYGTVISSAVALFFAVPISVGAAIFLAELAPPWLRTPASYLIEMLAAIPSVILGLWALYFLVPIIRDPVEIFLNDHFAWIPLFDGPTFGVGLLSAGVILAIMILPIITAVSRDILLAVPNSQREAMYALGATKWEVISGAVIPYARSGIIGAVILGLGRAMGETMAVTMVIGNQFKIPHSLFDPAHTIASGIASQFPEASAGVFIGSLVYLALILFVVSLLINIAARVLVGRLVRAPSRVRE
jgi:phosphate transport system permease protein